MVRPAERDGIARRFEEELFGRRIEHALVQAEEIFAIIALEAVGACALPELGAGALELGKDGLASDLGGALEPDLARGDGVRGLRFRLVGEVGDAFGGLRPLRRVHCIRGGLRRVRCGFRRVTADNRLPPRADAAGALGRVLCPGFCSRYALFQTRALRLDRTWIQSDRTYGARLT